MSAVWKSTCVACGERHTFHFRDAQVLPQQQAYEYTCPRTHELTLYVADLVDTSFDLVISLTPEAHHQALKLAEGKAMEAVYWPTPDPTGATGSREQILDAYRAARDYLKVRIVTRFGQGPSVGG